MNMNGWIGQRPSVSDALFLIGGAAFFALGFRMFLLPNVIVLGGATGVATVLYTLFGFPAGAVSLCINLPLLVISLFLYGRGGFRRSIIGTLVLSAALDLFFFLPPLTEEPLIAALFGGALSGFGAALAFSRGFTSGGSDLAAYLLRHRFRRLSLGRLVMVIDGVIVIAAAVALSDFSGLFYSVLAILSFSYVLDEVASRSLRARLALLVCPRHMEGAVTEAIQSKVGRGITVLPAKGGYTGEDRSVLLCAMHPREAGAFTAAASGACPQLFLVFLPAPTVFGRRFREDMIDNTPIA